MYLGAKRRYINTLPFLSFPYILSQGQSLKFKATGGNCSFSDESDSEIGKSGFRFGRQKSRPKLETVNK